jgi:hypothetical protein
MSIPLPRRNGQENRRRPHGGGGGLPVDFTGGPTVDPTENVKDLSEALSQRQDDLRTLTRELFDTQIGQVKEIGQLRAEHQRHMDAQRDEHARQMLAAESARLNSIRQVDREEVAKTAVTNQTATTALASQTSILAETLRTQVSTVAGAAEARASAVATAGENRLNQFSADVIKRLSALELSFSEGRGKQAVVDPQVTEMLMEMRALRNSQSLGVGQRQGMSDTARSIIAALGVLVTLTVLYAFTQRQSAPTAAAPQVIYIPAPAGALLPTTPPQPTPR